MTRWHSNNLAPACDHEPGSHDDLPLMIRASIIALVVLVFAALLFGAAAFEGVK